MSAGTKGLLVGLILGVWVAWTNWQPDGYTTPAAVRAAANVLGAMAICWLIARMISKRRA